MSTSLRSGGLWIATLGAWDDLKWSHTADGGCEDASWSMALPENFTHPALRTGQVVEVFVGPARVWYGVLAEPDHNGDGFEYSAVGFADDLHTGWSCLADATGTPTSTPDVAVNQAISRGLPCALPASLSASAFADDDNTNALNYVGQLLDAWADGVSERWRVNADGSITAAVDPTTPTWYLTPGSARLALADDDYASDLYLRYIGTDFKYATVHVNDALATASRRREYNVDASNLGITTNGIVSGVGIGLLAKGKARYAWTEAANPSSLQLTTPGGQPAFLPFVKAGDMCRLHGVMNEQGVPLPYYDFIIGRVEYVDKADTILIAPAQLAVRTLGDGLAVA